MLTELSIRNFAIIESVTLPLVPGFNVLSGETGAGKSIIVGALGLLLGERGSADLVRTGADRASVEGVFDASNAPELAEQLDARGIEVEERTVVLRREVATTGKGRAWINGTPVTAAVLSEVGRALVNLHGQHESQALLGTDAQRAVLDAFSGATDTARAVREAHSALASVRAEIETLASRRAAVEQRADYLRHVTREIADAKLMEGEEVRLEDEARRLSHVEDLRSHLALVHESLDGGEHAILSQLALARKALSAAERLDPTLQTLQESLDEALVSLEEIERDLDAYVASLEREPDRLREVERRRDVVYRVTKKYGGSVASALETLRTSRGELELLDTADLDLRALRDRAGEAEQALCSKAADLTYRRTSGARQLESAVEAILPDLGLPDGRFHVALVTCDPIVATGAEDAEFRVSLNVGHEARPLARVASGGELSRVMLALKTILTRLDRIPTLVFDEVDSGIGGAVALRVGDALRGLSAHHQVLVITHLAQIAARAHHHIVVSKGARAGITTADIAVVTDDERIGELARMLDGNPRSDVSRAHARELLDRAAQPSGSRPRRARR
jgi:DNA repair protein RecN (Recombination protein N)